MNDNPLLVDEEAGVVTLTLNRPEVMNSLNFSMLLALKEQIESHRFNRDIRVVIITGAGEKAFCAGADLKERATMSPDQVREYIFTIRNLFTSIEQLNCENCQGRGPGESTRARLQWQWERPRFSRYFWW